jgi:hypothetical protein
MRVKVSRAAQLAAPELAPAPVALINLSAFCCAARIAPLLPENVSPSDLSCTLTQASGHSLADIDTGATIQHANTDQSDPSGNAETCTDGLPFIDLDLMQLLLRQNLAYAVFIDDRARIVEKVRPGIRMPHYLVYAGSMNNDTDIILSGPFKATDGAGHAHDIKAMRIFDEGYGVIDVYIDFGAPIDARLIQEKAFIGQIMTRFHSLGYVGPSLIRGDPGLQDKKLMVLEAPEEFNPYAASKGWKNLAEDFDDE